MALERVNLTAIMDRMERNPLIQREAHPSDRRSCLVRLAPEGYERLNCAIDLYLPAIAPLLAPPDATELETTRQTLAKVFSLPH
jgi:DNA-binding MarR family transcriptional regulator